MAKLKKMILIKGKMRTLSGISIIGYAGARRIGGVDNPVIRDPLTDLPYVPGSSLRGKMRSLMELKLEKYYKDGEPHKLLNECVNENCIICRLFGSIPANRDVDEDARKKLGPTRLLVRDAYPDENSEKMLREYLVKTGLPYTEIKMENYLNRLKAKAVPRQNERIPAGVVFDIEMVLKIFEGDKVQEYLKHIKECLEMVEMDSIGGSGSRGYGKVRFEDMKVVIDGKEIPFEEAMNSDLETA
ncbi:MAG: type III-A CRISPR-associated RAMP protein Csm3 [Archaeoglobaceae archaeon]